MTSEAHVPRKQKIVVVDDDAMVLRVHAEMIKAMGYIPFTFEQPEDAIGYLRGHAEHVAMLITDYNMPAMNGLELVGRLRDLGCDLPSMVLTAYSNQMDASLVEKCNVKVVSKPVRIHALNNHVQSLLLQHC